MLFHVKTTIIGLFILIIAVLTGQVTHAKQIGAEYQGVASWYGSFHHGRKTASGAIFNMHGLTAAHRTLPLGTKVLVTNRKTGKSVNVTINDRGPYHGNRLIDLSKGAATKIDMIKSGVAQVEVQVISLPNKTKSKQQRNREALSASASKKAPVQTIKTPPVPTTPTITERLAVDPLERLIVEIERQELPKDSMFSRPQFIPVALNTSLAINTVDRSHMTF